MFRSTIAAIDTHFTGGLVGHGRRMARGFSSGFARAHSSLRRRLAGRGGDAGMSTAEYAVGTIAACAFAAVLYQVVTGDSIASALRDLIESALSSLS